jgi:acyl-coenzyme A thioesterase PaaI-like protein
MSNALQDKYAAKSICFGCGPANKQGLQIKSVVNSTGDKVTAEWKPQTFHEAFPGMINGGIIGSLLDCHCNWTAAWHIMNQKGESQPPCTVTAEYTIKLLRPTPSGKLLHLEAWVAEDLGDRAWIEGTLSCEGKVTATCRGLFVAVKPGHPAYHRW